MSQKLVHHTIEKTCEGCGVVKQYDLVEATPEIIKEMENWYAVVREMLVPDLQNGGAKYEKFMVQAHDPGCVPVALLKLMKLGIAVDPEPEDEIDLASLQQQKEVVN